MRSCLRTKSRRLGEHIYRFDRRTGEGVNFGLGVTLARENAVQAWLLVRNIQKADPQKQVQFREKFEGLGNGIKMWPEPVNGLDRSQGETVHSAL